MKPFSLPFSVFMELSKQIETVEADKFFSGYILCQSKEGLKLLEKRVKGIRKKIICQVSSKEKEKDEMLGNEKFKKIRELKRRLGGKLRPLTDKERQELKNA